MECNRHRAVMTDLSSRRLHFNRSALSSTTVELPRRGKRRAAAFISVPSVGRLFRNALLMSS